MSQNERETLPVHYEVPGHPGFELIRDLCHLEDQGLIDGTVVRSRDYTAAAAILDDLNLHGCYEQHVRITGTIYTCPDWCISTYHPRRGIHEADGLGVNHTAYSGSVGKVSIDLDAVDDEPLRILVSYDAELTAAEARRVAAHLLNAADTLDKLNQAG